MCTANYCLGSRLVAFIKFCWENIAQSHRNSIKLWKRYPSVSTYRYKLNIYATFSFPDVCFHYFGCLFILIFFLLRWISQSWRPFRTLHLQWSTWRRLWWFCSLRAAAWRRIGAGRRRGPSWARLSCRASVKSAWLMPIWFVHWPWPRPCPASPQCSHYGWIARWICSLRGEHVTLNL